MNTKNNFKVNGFRKTIKEFNDVPAGFHVEIWACVDNDKKTIELYTSEYLSQNSWSTNHGENEYRFSYNKWYNSTLTAQLKGWLDEFDGVNTPSVWW